MSIPIPATPERLRLAADLLRSAVDTIGKRREFPRNKKDPLYECNCPKDWAPEPGCIDQAQRELTNARSLLAFGSTPEEIAGYVTQARDDIQRAIDSLHPLCALANYFDESEDVTFMGYCPTDPESKRILDWDSNDPVFDFSRCGRLLSEAQRWIASQGKAMRATAAGLDAAANTTAATTVVGAAETHAPEANDELATDILDPAKWVTLQAAATRLFDGCKDLKDLSYASVASAKTTISKMRDRKELQCEGKRGDPRYYVGEIDALIHARRQKDMDDEDRTTSEDRCHR